MSDPYLGQITMMANNFAPKGYAYCNGTLLAIKGNESLFSLLGTTWGGNGTTNFALPEMRGRVPMGQGSGPGLTHRHLGQGFGVEQVTLNINQLPSHPHDLNASANPTDVSSAQGAVVSTANRAMYGPSAAPPDYALDPGSIGRAGGGRSHTNMMPYLCVGFVIALQGVYPSRN